MVAYFDTGRLNNGGTEAINLLIEKTDNAWRTASATSPTTGTDPARWQRNTPLPASCHTCINPKSPQIGVYDRSFDNCAHSPFTKVCSIVLIAASQTDFSVRRRPIG